MSQGAITEYLGQLIAMQVDDKGLVVWYGLEQSHGSAAAELTGPKSIVARDDDSFFKPRRAANLHLEPAPNDGVVLNIAPLGEIVPWNEATKYSDELMDGQYEWSSIGKQLREKGLVK